MIKQEIQNHCEVKSNASYSKWHTQQGHGGPNGSFYPSIHRLGPNSYHHTSTQQSQYPPNSQSQGLDKRCLHINSVPPQIKEQMKDVPSPHTHDVLCGRGGSSNRHIGNTNFRDLVQSNKALYVTLTKRQKMMVARSIVQIVRSQNPPGRFLQKDPETALWFDIGRARALEKTSQALREKPSSSSDKGSSKLQKSATDKDGQKSTLIGSTLKESPSHPTKTKEKKFYCSDHPHDNNSDEIPPITIPDHLPQFQVSCLSRKEPSPQFIVKSLGRPHNYTSRSTHEKAGTGPYPPQFHSNVRPSSAHQVPNGRTYSRQMMHSEENHQHPRTMHPPKAPPMPPHSFRSMEPYYQDSQQAQTNGPEKTATSRITQGPHRIGLNEHQYTHKEITHHEHKSRPLHPKPHFSAHGPNQARHSDNCSSEAYSSPYLVDLNKNDYHLHNYHPDTEGRFACVGPNQTQNAHHTPLPPHNQFKIHRSRAYDPEQRIIPQVSLSSSSSFSSSHNSPVIESHGSRMNSLPPAAPPRLPPPPPPYQQRAFDGYSGNQHKRMRVEYVHGTQGGHIAPPIHHYNSNNRQSQYPSATTFGQHQGLSHDGSKLPRKQYRTIEQNHPPYYSQQHLQDLSREFRPPSPKGMDNTNPNKRKAIDVRNDAVSENSQKIAYTRDIKNPTPSTANEDRAQEVSLSSSSSVTEASCISTSNESQEKGNDTSKKAPFIGGLAALSKAASLIE